MEDRVYPSTKPNPPHPRSNNGPTKPGQLYNPTRPPPARRATRSWRKCCCLTFIYTLLALLTLLLAAIGACVFYVLYHPNHPTFAVSTVTISKFNLSDSDASGLTHLNSRLELTITAKNPNHKDIAYEYEPISVVVNAAGVEAGNATLPSFRHVSGNTTILKASVLSDPTRGFDSDTVSRLGWYLVKRSGFPVTAVLDTMVEVQMGKIKTKKVGIRVTCDGIKGFQPKNGKSKTPTRGTIEDSKCKVDLRIKIWKFTF